MSDEEVSIALVRHSIREIRRTVGGGMGIVRCRNFRGLAVRKKNGRWQDAHGRVLKVIEVIEEF
jgi:hypothetical protein